LLHEVQVLHLQFFRCAAPKTLIDGYLRFHAESPNMVYATQDEHQTVATVVNKRLDALGIEPWLRGGSPRHLLSRKLLLIAYLAECDAAHPDYRQAVRGCLRSFLQLGSSALVGGWHLLKGRLQMVAYGLL
jgi:hypothetical protein